MKQSRLTLIVGLILVLIFGLLLFTFQVRQTEVAVVTTFGKPGADYTEPGLKMKLPWPIQNVYRFDKRIQNFESKYEEALTEDNLNLMVAVYAGWKIVDPKVFLQRFKDGSVAEAERSLGGLVSSAKNARVAKHPFAHFISPDEKNLKLVEIEQEILKEIQSPARKNYGVEVTFLGIKKLGLPESITAKVFDRMRAERQRLVLQYQGQGESESIRIRSAANKDRDEILSKAEGEATRIRGQADAEASKAYRAMEQAPELAIFLQGLNALSETLKERATLIFDQRTPPFDLLNRKAEVPVK